MAKGQVLECQKAVMSEAEDTTECQGGVLQGPHRSLRLASLSEAVKVINRRQLRAGFLLQLLFQGSRLVLELPCQPFCLQPTKGHSERWTCTDPPQ